MAACMDVSGFNALTQRHVELAKGHVPAAEQEKLMQKKSGCVATTSLRRIAELRQERFPSFRAGRSTGRSRERGKAPLRRKGGVRAVSVTT